MHEMDSLVWNQGAWASDLPAQRSVIPREGRDDGVKDVKKSRKAPAGGDRESSLLQSSVADSIASCCVSKICAASPRLSSAVPIFMRMKALVV